MRATNYRHYADDHNAKVSKTQKTKNNKRFKAFSFVIAVSLTAVALVVPTTTLAPNVDAFEDSRAASYSVGNINEFSAVITSNCVEETTTPATQVETTVAETTAPVETTKADKKNDQKAVEETKATENKAESKAESSEPKETKPTESTPSTNNNDNYDAVQAEGYLLNISNPDPNYSPKRVSLSSYDRAKLERLVMGEAGSMGFNGCALVAQAIRDAMNRSNTTSIDTIIRDYQYFAPTNKQPNQNVKDAVSYIFDENGSAVQHRVLCFYTGKSEWHETQTFVVACGSVRFFDLKY